MLTSLFISGILLKYCFVSIFTVGLSFDQLILKDWLKSKTKPNGKKPPAEEKKQYLEPEFTKVRVVDFDLKELVVLPREIDLNEWLASNRIVTFPLCYSLSRIYYWYDEKGKKTKCTAPQYVDFVMSLCQKLVTDEEIFPTKYGKEFPNSFESLVKKICRYLFHVLAHLYWAHFKETVALELQGHLNTLYAHFIVFVREFNLVDPKETCIMDDLSEILCTPAPLPALTPAPSATAPSPSSQNHKERQSLPPSTTTITTRVVPFISFSMRMQERPLRIKNCSAAMPQAAYYPII
uniref:MOB kinase activator 2a n=1 Tax=Neolamprologus brichardi TaxID=32507 RepID=A0A3Q4HBE0_NEOBR